MAHHDEFIERISAAIDGALSPDERAELEAHLTSCPHCKALYDDLMGIHQALSALPTVAVPAGLTQRVMEAVAADNMVALPKKQPVFQWKRWAATAAVLALILAGAGGMSLLRGGRELTAPAPKSAESIDPTLARSLSPEQEAASLPSDDAQVKASADPRPASSAEPPALIQTTQGSAVAPVPSFVPDANPGWDAAPTPNSANSAENPAGDTSTAMPPVEEPAAPADAPTGYLVNPMTQMPVIPVPSGPAIPDGQEDETPEIGVMSVGLELEMTPREALDILLAAYPMPEDAVLIDTEDFLGWQTPFTDDPSQSVSTQLCYWRLTPNGKYHEFRGYSCFLEPLLTDEFRTSTLNFYAVPLDGGEILTQRHDYEGGPDSPGWEAYMAEWEEYNEATCN